MSPLPEFDVSDQMMANTFRIGWSIWVSAVFDLHLMSDDRPVDRLTGADFLER